ncbi:MAG: hypothetical protein H6858_06210 [Rhodospirillales bacterium]|nr:hypothetical protein [Rhodospirillales bacterium]
MKERLLNGLKRFKAGTGWFFSGFMRFFAGFLCCWTPLSAPLLSGWLNRYMLRSAVHVWVKRSTQENPRSFYEAADAGVYKDWPHWSDVPGLALAPAASAGGFLSKLYARGWYFFRALWTQYRSGLLSLFNTWLLTLPFALVWLWMWWAGWNNTFSRGYEEEGLATVLSLISVAGFSIVMLYLPIAQARQAIHGTWKSFFDFRTVRTIARHVRVRLLILAIFYALGSAGIMAGTKVIPTFFEQAYHVDLGDAKAVKDKVFGHFLLVILCFYSGLLIVKRMNARVYALGVLKALQSKRLAPDQLAPIERDLLLDRLTFKEPSIKENASRWRRILAWPLRKAGPFLLVLATLILWGSVAFSVYFGQFINLHYADWLNQPLIQMPYIRMPQIPD